MIELVLYRTVQLVLLHIIILQPPYQIDIASQFDN